ncbi:MAG: hypothetical protein LKI76_08980 [Megasphaera sp.]|jgi:hypothetical protein|uniref:hypothetical protein n=1 Tax=Megasphaera sueciensis TaxID=349094 RepID=UPI003D039886|nr:hypothetical protein [Megasphaera sp.]
MNKLKNALLAVVFFYTLYAIMHDGPSRVMVGILLLDVFICVMNCWMKSNTRRKMHEKNRK